MIMMSEKQLEWQMHIWKVVMKEERIWLRN